ncbi:MAG: rhomboid family intramembrane serine protease [Marinilabiliales bacterium]|nr:MAG: rhomboid family intramembrane serine protease [Marinilabiliales bacterium]
MSIIDEIKTSFQKGSMLTKLIYINLAVFVAVKLVQVVLFLFSTGQPGTFFLIDWLAVPANIEGLLSRPWTIFTYMFLHEGFLHILFNILWLFWFGRIFLEYLDENKLLGVYILGGLAGAALYIFAFNVFPVFAQVLPVSRALGASAAVLAVVISISVYVPNYTINLVFIGPVRLKYIAAFMIVLDVISIAGSNAGGHIAHLGGALFGWLFIRQYRKGKDLTRGINVLFFKIASLFKPPRKLKVEYRKSRTDYDYHRQKAERQKRIDDILDKISKSGYDSLSKEEKEILFRVSNKS